MGKFLDASGVSRLWTKMKSYVAEQISATLETADETGEIECVNWDDAADDAYFGYVLPSAGIYLLYLEIGIKSYAIVNVTDEPAASPRYSMTITTSSSEIFVQNGDTLEIVCGNYGYSDYEDMVTGCWKKLM